MTDTERDGTGDDNEVTLGGKTFTLSDPTDDDKTEIVRRIQKELRSPLEMIVPVLEKTANPDIQEMMVRAALDKEPEFKDEITEGQIEKFADTRKGQIFSFWLMARKNHPEVTEDEIAELFRQEEKAALAKVLADADEDDEDDETDSDAESEEEAPAPEEESKDE